MTKTQINMDNNSSGSKKQRIPSFVPMINLDKTNLSQTKKRKEVMDVPILFKDSDDREENLDEENDAPAMTLNNLHDLVM